MENNITFMHSKPTPFFVPRLPFQSPSPIKKNRLQWCGGDGLMQSCGDLGTSGFFFHNCIQASTTASRLKNPVGKGCVFQPGSKIVDLGFVKFKSNGTTAKRPLEQIQKTTRSKKKQFFWFSLGVLHGFSRKSNNDEFSRKSNGGWIFLGIKRGFFFASSAAVVFFSLAQKLWIQGS